MTAPSEKRAPLMAKERRKTGSDTALLHPAGLSRSRDIWRPARAATWPGRMTDYAPASSFGWLDYNEDDAQKMREMLRSFEEHGTVDSLGLGVIRDAFSDLLFPATSTIQTRARYFLFVPWICKQLEEDRTLPADFERRLRDREVALIESLKTGGVPDSSGVIGYVAGKRVKRLPTSVYWNGLYRLGIRTTAASFQEYRRDLPSHYRRLRHISLDDNRDPTGSVPRNWDPHLPKQPEGFPDAPTTLDLRPAEARFLADRIESAGLGTLFAELIRDPARAELATAPWEVSQDGFSASLRRTLWHARNFAEIVHGAQLLYNVLLVENVQRDLAHAHEELLARMRNQLDGWAQTIRQREGVLREWLSHLDEFWIAVGVHARIRPRTRRFVEDLAIRSIERPESIGDDPEARLQVVERERALKGKLARLSDRRALENWKGQPLGADRFTYRWGISTQIIRDISAGLARGDA